MTISWIVTGTATLLPAGETLCFRSYREGYRAAKAGVSHVDAERRAARRGKRGRHRGEFMRGWVDATANAMA